MNPNDLATVISFETVGTFDPSIRNPKSSATGLIQKMRDPDGKYYGYTRDELGSMSFEEQMEKVVLRYFQERGFSADKPVSLAEIYEAVAGSGYKKGSQAYELNKVWDTNKDGVIDRYEAVKSKQFQAHVRDYMGADGADKFRQLAGLQDSVSLKAPASSAVSKNVSVNVASVTVNTAANTLPAATAEGVAAGIERGSGLLDQLGGGI